MVRISAQLIDAATDRNVWADSWERSLSDVLGIQSEVARAIVQNVRVHVTPEEQTRLATAQRVNPVAQEAYLRGREYFNRSSIEGFRTAIEQFESAIERDPTYAPAYAGLADAYCALSSIQIPAKEAMPRGHAAATKAVELDPNLAAGYVSLAYVQAFYEWNWSDGERTFRRAISLNSNEATAHQFLAQLLMCIQRFDEASAELSRAREIDPLSSYIAGMSLWPIYYRRDYATAGEAARVLMAADPKNAIPHFIHGVALTMLGDSARGTAEFDRAYDLDPRAYYLAYAGWGRARAGDRQGALGVLRKLRVLSETSYVQPYSMAVIFASLGESDSAFAALERGIELRSEDMIETQNSPAMDPLRSDPRFKAILRKLNFPA